ncbi:ATG4 [Candida margitis]|uniref:ATG4 n=1 Tax=Candida margitis TaxID=1775924 RepID=UPI002227C6C7|nr:ATG4 [Candida margitis]KAI5967705.1 ATG4 [Candida margitis]
MLDLHSESGHQDPDNNKSDQSQSAGSVTEGGFERFTSFFKGISGVNREDEEAKENNESPEHSKANEVKNIVILGKNFNTQNGASEYMRSLLWFSYRCGFIPIPKASDGPQPVTFFPSILFSKSTLTNVGNLRSLLDNDNFSSDAGWGCMIRTSQNLLANALLKLSGKLDESTQLEILQLFQDDPSSAFSIHNFIRVASSSSLSIKPGQWFGPNAASLSIKELALEVKDRNLSHQVPCVYISENADLYDDGVEELFNKALTPLLLLFPVRLGIDQVNKYYYHSILQLLASKFSVGIAGGKPSSSFYFIGYENEQDLIYFDPHLPQVAESPINLSSYHTVNYSKLNVGQLDPSMMIGILLGTMNDYIEFKSECTENKIIHFHPLITTSHQDSTLNQSWQEVQEDDDFVNLTVPKSEEEFVVLDE